MSEILTSPEVTVNTIQNPVLVETNNSPRQKTYWSDEELEFFRELILKKIQAQEEFAREAKEKIWNAREQRGSAYSGHMAEAGTDAMEIEKLGLFIARAKKHIRLLMKALDRIDNKTYGICRITDQLIQKKRLESVPHTDISIGAKLALMA